MSLSTATPFAWGTYAARWTLRAIGLSLVVTFVVGGGVFVLTRSGVAAWLLTSFGLFIVFGVTLLWTVAEMITDGLQSD